MGKSYKRLKSIYYGMKTRCYNPNSANYKYYGEKGITICDEWLKDKNKFYEWSLNNGYQDNLTIDRINTNGNYEPNNCKWATMLEQGRNKSNNVLIGYNGEIKTASQWKEETGINGSTLKYRTEKGKDMLKDCYPACSIEINGEIKTLREISEESGIPYNVIQQRYYYMGWNAKDLTQEIDDTNRETQYIEINGKTHTVTEWAEISGLTREIIINRMSYGWKNEDLLKPRQHEGKKSYYKINEEIHTRNEWCEILNISPMTFYRRLKRGLISII